MYSNEPRGQGGWPAQPPQHTPRRGRRDYDEGRGRRGDEEGGRRGYHEGGLLRERQAQPPEYTAGRGRRGYDRDDRGYDRDGRGYDRDRRGYDRDGRGYERDDRGYDRDGRGYERDDRGYDRNGRGYERRGLLSEPEPDRRYWSARTFRMGGRHRGRWIALLITLVVLVVVAFIADNVARSYAQNMIASKIQTSSGMIAKPSVTIEGFPFLTQVAAHDVRVVDISASNIQEGKLDITSIKAKATGVHLSSSFNSATIDQINGTALVTFASLEKAIGVPGVATITADPAHGPNAVKLNAGPLGNITGKIEVTGPNRVTLQVGSLSGLGSLLGGAVQIPTSETFQIPKLPVGLVVRSVSVTSQGIVATASAQNTTLSQ